MALCLHLVHLVWPPLMTRGARLIYTHNASVAGALAYTSANTSV